MTGAPTAGGDRSPTAPADPTGAGRTAPTVHRARLADRVVTWRAPGPAGHHGRAAPPGEPGPLLLVTQVGRAFEDAHPSVRPVVRRGRHLVVEDGEPSFLGRADLCWKAEPLTPDRVVVDAVRPVASPAAPAIEELLGLLSAASYGADVARLAGSTTRHSLSAGFRAAADWTGERLAALGYAVTRMPVAVGGGESANVIADRPGTGSARGLVLVTAHLDSVNTAGGPTAPAPGADDDASGTAGVLEMARVLATRSWAHDLRLVLFGGEEQGLLGSTRFVATLPAADRHRIRAVLDMDMIAGHNTPVPTVLLEGAAVSTGLLDDLAAAATAYTGLTAETSLSPFASDHVPFIDAGIPAVLTIEGGDGANADVHTAQDVAEHLDIPLALQILRMNLAATAGWLGGGRDAPRPAGPVVARTRDRLDVFATTPGGRVVHTAWDGCAWRPGVPRYDDLGTPGR